MSAKTDTGQSGFLKKKDTILEYEVFVNLCAKINRLNVTGLDGEVVKVEEHQFWGVTLLEKSQTKALALVKDTLQAPFESFCAVASAYEDVWGQSVHSDGIENIPAAAFL